MKKLAKISAGLLALVIVAAAGLSLFIGTLDADKYRPQLVQILSEKTGRSVKLDGPISFSLGMGGVKVSMRDASIGNPAWSSRPSLAAVGRFDVQVGLMPFFAHKVVINSLVIENADILLETNAAGKNNWDFSTAPAADKTVQTKDVKVEAKPAPSTSSATAMGLSVGKLSIINSQIATRAADGRTSAYSVSNVTLESKGADVLVTFAGEAAGTPITIAAKTGATNLLSKAAFPFDAKLTVGDLKIGASGTADLGGNRADIAAFQVIKGKTEITGKATAIWGGAKPVLRGDIYSAQFDLNDFKAAEATSNAAAGNAKSAKAANAHMFSDAPLPLDILYTVDADFAANADKVLIKRGSLEKVEARLTVRNGTLSLSPVRAAIGNGNVAIQLIFDAAQSPARLSLTMKADNADLGALQKLGDMAPFMSGSAGASVQLVATGNTPHALASSLNGLISVTADKGEIIGSAISGVSSALAAVFNPGGGDSAINCLAVRFIARNGLLTDNGILIDSVPTTLSGKGGVHLGAETVDLTLRAKTKLVDIGSFVPALHVGGNLASPSYSVNAVDGVANVVGGLMNGNLSLGSSDVPEIQTAPAGQNACIYTLDHPKAASSSTVLPADMVGKANQSIQNIGNSLMKGLFGK